MSEPQPISAEALSDLIGKIYDCAVDRSCWPVAMEAVRVALGFQLATLNLQRLPNFEVVLNVTCNVPAAYIPMIDRAGPDVVEQWGGAERIASLPMHEPGVLSWVNPDFDPQTTSNRYYHEFARPQGLIDVMAVVLARDEEGLGSVAWGRAASAGPITEREVAVARLLVPHLQRAAAINRLFEAADLARAELEAAFDRLKVPVVIADRERRLLYGNAASRRLMERDDLLQLRQGVLTVHGADASHALAEALSSLEVPVLGAGAAAIPVRGRTGRAGVLHVLPLTSSRGSGLGAGRAAIFVGQAGGAAAPPGGLVEALFGLTAAEGKVFGGVASGLTVAATAHELGVAPATVKTHLLRLYQKTGVHRREELIQMAASLALPLER